MSKELAKKKLNELIKVDESKLNCPSGIPWGEDVEGRLNESKQALDWVNNQNDWVSVDERLPEESKDIEIIPETECRQPARTGYLLVCTRSGEYYKNARLKMMVGNKDWKWFCEHESKIIAWKKIQPPKSK